MDFVLHAAAKHNNIITIIARVGDSSSLSLSVGRGGGVDGYITSP